MLAIKLKIVGKKHQRSFRFVVQERRSKLNGKFIEDLGWYNPHTNKFEIDKERAKHWMKVGAKPTMTTAQIFKKSKIDLPVGTRTSRTYSVKKKDASTGASTELSRMSSAQGGVAKTAEAPKGEMKVEAPAAEAPKPQ